MPYFLATFSARHAHVIFVEHVSQTVADHRVDHFGIAHTDAVTQMNRVRRLAHAFMPPATMILASSALIAM